MIGPNASHQVLLADKLASPFKQSNQDADRALLRARWQPAWNQFFPAGADDETAIFVQLEADRAGILRAEDDRRFRPGAHGSGAKRAAMVPEQL